MPTPTRIYAVRRKDGTGSPRMVEAAHRDTALRHVALDTMKVEVLSAVETLALMQTGVEVCVSCAECRRTAAAATDVTNTRPASASSRCTALNCWPGRSFFDEHVSRALRTGWILLPPHDLPVRAERSAALLYESARC